MKRIALVITTYQRNGMLVDLVQQCVGMVNSYGGNNVYVICVADSDHENPLAADLVGSGLKYSVNPGTGFDENLLYFWGAKHTQYDYIFSISDDDIFTPGANALYMLDAAVDFGVEAVLFNHRDLHRNAPGEAQAGLRAGGLFYQDWAMSFDFERMFATILTLLPRHVGLMYSTKLLREDLQTIALFKGTRHLYAAPLVIACQHRSARFIDYPLCLFDCEDKADGSWSESAGVLNGLAAFLEGLKQILPAEQYAVAEKGFFHHYLGSGAWLRKLIRERPELWSEEKIRGRLEAIKPPDSGVRSGR